MLVLQTDARLIKDLTSLQRPHHVYTETTALASHPCLYSVSIFIYHIQSGTSPSYMLSMVTTCFASSFRGLRSSRLGDYSVIRTNLKFGNRAFSVSGPMKWNSLPDSVCQCTPVAQFKSKLNFLLLSLCFD